MRSIRIPESKQATTLLVAVRCRPLTAKEQARSRDILRVIDDKVVVVLDPDVSKDYLDRIQNRSKEKQYVFDVACGTESTNKDVYDKTIGSMVEGVIQGLNATVFAYGATGSGKTHTMAGTEDDPGLMVLSLQKIFTLVASEEGKHEFEVTCSYLEVYNEVIYDLLEKSSGHLELREDPDQGITVAGLKRIQVNSAEKILELLKQGNNRRKTESTNANATSSRSHAVLEIIVRRKQRNHYRSQVLHGKLALVDLAGSERASETNNAGQKLRDGANINKSLLALANCINALGKQQKKGLAYVPYRNSKLTRLLKDGLSGNSRTVMVATVSPGGDQYHHTINTLKYADRAKEIKTHIQTNVGTVDAHVADYQRMIDNLQVEVSQLRRELAEKETILNSRAPDKSSDDELLWLDALSHGISENVEERVNLQKALFELEDMNMRNRTELQQLDELIAEYQNHVGESEISNELIEHRQIVLDNIRDNDEAGTHYRQEIELNEAQRKELQQQIDDAISRNRNQTYLRILSQYRLLGMTNMELQFQMAIRDQIIQDQREALENMWRLLKSLGLNDKQILEVASQRGVLIENGLLSPCLSAKPHLHTVTMVGASCNISKRACGARLSNLVPLPISLDADGTAESGLFKKYINGFEAKETSFVNIPSFGKMLPGFREKEGFLEGNETMKCTNAQALDCFDAKPFSQTNFTSSNNVKFLPSSPNFTDVQVSDNRTLTKASKGLAKELPSDCLQCDQKDLNLAKRIRWPPSAEQQIVECFHEATDGARDDVEEKSEIVKTSETLCKLSGYHIVEGKSKSPAEKTLLQKELLRLDTELQDLTKAREHSPQKAYFDSKILSATPCTAQRCLTPLHYDNEALTATKNNHLLKPDSCENVSGHHGTGFVQHFPSFSNFTNLSLGSGGCDTTSCNDMAVTPACLSPSKFHDEQGLLNLRHKSLAAKIHFPNVNNGTGIQPTGTCDQCCCHLIR